MGPTWVQSSAVFISLVALPPGKSWFNTKLVCEDPTTADNYATFIVEDEVIGGPIGRVFPLWEKWVYETSETRTRYKVIENFGTDNATVPVAAVVRALKEGNTSCELKIGDPTDYRTALLNVSVTPRVNEVSYSEI